MSESMAAGWLHADNLAGVYTALVTPFRRDRVDTDALEALCDRQVQGGVAGLVPCGTTGEAPTLDADEWSQVVSSSVNVAAAAGRKVPVIAGCGTNSTRGTVAWVERAASLGADAALVVLPYYNKPTFAGLVAHVEAACEVGLPIVLYHIPGRTAQRLSVAQLAQLCHLPGVIGVKEATADLTFDLDLLSMKPGALLSGDDFTMAPLMAMGGAGVISVLSNVAPKMTVAFAEAARTGDVAALRALNARLFPVCQYLFAETNPVPVKAALAAMGLCDGALRLPMLAGAPPPPGLLDGLT